MNLSPPPTNEKDHNSFPWTKWYSLVYSSLDTLVKDSSSTVQTAWTKISKAGSKLSDLETRNHSELQNIDSGDARHLTKSQYFNLTDTGQTSLHKHDHAKQDNLDSADYSHLSAVQKTDLTDGGETILHKHDFNHVTYPAANFIGVPSHIYTLQELMDHEWSAGVVDGCVLTDNGDGTISIGAGVAVIRAVPDGHTTIFGVALAEQLNIALTTDATNYVYLNYNAGVPIFSVSTVITSFNCMDKCIAYMVHRQGNVLHWIDAREQNVDSNRKLRQFLLRSSRFSHDSGGTVLGSVSGLTLSCTAGAFNFMLQSVPHDAFDTSVAGTTNVNVFTNWYVTAGVWTQVPSSKVIVTTNYNDLATGLVTLGNNKFGVSWVYIVNDSPSELHVVKGQDEYPNLDSAKVASPPTIIPSLVAGFGVLIGFVVYEKGVTVFNNIYSAFSTAFTPSQAALHNSLAGLQGGTLNEYYHLTAAEYAALGSTAITLATARQIASLRV